MKFEVTHGPKWLEKYIPVLGQLFDSYFEKLLGKSWISVNFVSRDEIRELNEKYKKLAHATDVLSFPYVFVDSAENMSDEELGEVYVSEEVVAENAKRYKVTLEEEVIRVMVHGSLHVLGYDHRGTLDNHDDEDKEMFEMQEHLVKEVLAN